MVTGRDFADVGFLLALAVFVDVAALVEEDFELEDALGLAFAWVRGVPVFALGLFADLEPLVLARVDALAVALGLAGVFFLATDFFPLATAFWAADFCVDFAPVFLVTGFRADFADADLAAVFLTAGLATAFALEVAAFVAVFLAVVLVFFALALFAAGLGLGFGFVVEDLGAAFLAVADLAATLATDFLAVDFVAVFLAALDFASPLGDVCFVVGDCPCASLPSVADALDCVDSADSVALSGASLFDSVGNVIFDSLHEAQEWKSAKLPKITPDC